MTRLAWVARQLLLVYLCELWLPFCEWLTRAWWAPLLPFAALAAVAVWVCA